PLLRAEALERAIDFLAPSHRVSRVIHRGVEKRSLVNDECPRSAAAPGPDRTTAIDENAEQPCAEALRILASDQRSIGARKGVLKRLFRVLTIAEHVGGVARVPVSIPLDQDAKHLHIPA